jgi:cell fate regulator YaaT (PSP1 superfamily)
MKYAVRLIKNVFVPLDVPSNIELQHGQMVLALTERGEEAFKVFVINSDIAKLWEKLKLQSLKFIRVLKDEDLEILNTIKSEEVEAKLKCAMLVQKHKLNMNLSRCSITFDRKKITFYYTAPERVDFRELLKSLTQTFRRMRIDLKHIGVRDETALLEGTGVCGRELCCASFMRKFEPTSVKLAKDQGCPVTPGKISGLCGRLLCCLNYEYSNYLEAAKGMPPVGASVMTSEGLGKVMSINFLTSKIFVKFENGKIKDFEKQNLELVDADVNVDITTNQNTYIEEDFDYKDLEDS